LEALLRLGGLTPAGQLLEGSGVGADEGSAKGEEALQIRAGVFVPVGRLGELVVPVQLPQLGGVVTATGEGEAAVRRSRGGL